MNAIGIIVIIVIVVIIVTGIMVSLRKPKTTGSGGGQATGHNEKPETPHQPGADTGTGESQPSNPKPEQAIHEDGPQIHRNVI